MYEYLIYELRDSADWADHLAILMGRVDGDVHAPIMRKAADAIEELSNAGSIYGKAWTLGYDAGRDENKPKWIPVTERLPKIGEYVLVYLFNNSPYIAWIDRTGQWQTEEFWLDAENAPKAWMPLPPRQEPPKEE